MENVHDELSKNQFIINMIQISLESVKLDLKMKGVQRTHASPENSKNKYILLLYYIDVLDKYNMNLPTKPLKNMCPIYPREIFLDLPLLRMKEFHSIPIFYQFVRYAIFHFNY